MGRGLRGARRSLRDHRDVLVRTSVSGCVAPPRLYPETTLTDREGRAVALPGSGGITLGLHAGDPATGWAADHVMPGASIEDEHGEAAVAGPLHLLSCIGNSVRDRAGQHIGVIAGKRGGIAPGFWAPQLVSVEVTDRVGGCLVPGDRVVVEAEGRDLRLAAFPTITLSNLSPRVLDALPIAVDGSALSCDVSAIVPPELAGAGLGQDAWI